MPHQPILPLEPFLGVGFRWAIQASCNPNQKSIHYHLDQLLHQVGQSKDIVGQHGCLNTEASQFSPVPSIRIIQPRSIHPYNSTWITPTILYSIQRYEIISFGSTYILWDPDVDLSQSFVFLFFSNFTLT